MVFSINLFNMLQHFGAQLLLSPVDRPLQGILALESFPLSAWKGLQINPLPSKRRSRTSDITNRMQLLKCIYQLRIYKEPSHDELQAIVAGIGAIAFQKENHAEYELVGAQPRMIDGVMREGFIVNPKKRSS